MLETYLELFVFGIVLTWFATPQVIRVGHRFRIYGHSHGARKKEEIPRLGGLSIFLALVLAGVLLGFVLPAVHRQIASRCATLISLLLPAVLVLLVGIYDDIAGAAPWQKLLIEFLAAGIAWWVGIRIIALPVFGYPIHSPVLSFFLTEFWMLAVTNALNLIDGLDGLAAGIAFFVTLAMFIVAFIQGNAPISIIAITVAGALLGFLRFNLSPAKIFLGDTGSLFLGFLLGTLAVYTTEKSSTLLALAVPYLAFGVPLLDTSLAIVRRFLSGRPVFGADRDHIHHKLLKVWASPRQAVAALYGLAALFSIGSLLIVRSTQNILVLVIVLGGVTAWFLSTRVQYEELIEFRTYLTRAFRSQHRVVANQILIRKASRNLEEALDLGKGWEALTSTLHALDFDGARCSLVGWPKDSVPALPVWHRIDAGLPEHSWSVSIPLHSNDLTIGVLQLWRGFSKERMLFQFSSLLDTLIPPFEKRLSSEYEARAMNAEFKYSRQAGSQLENSLLETVEEKHEAVTSGHELARIGS